MDSVAQVGEFIPSFTADPVKFHYPEKFRRRIRAGMCLRRLHNHIAAPFPGTMSPSQVAAALGLLKKVLPDLSESKTDTTIRRVESLHEEQAGLLAASFIETQRRASARAVSADPVHDSVPARLPAG